MTRAASTTTTEKSWRRALRRLKPRGQAMVEYSVVTHALLIGGGVALLPVITRLLSALDTFYQGIYFILESGAI